MKKFMTLLCGFLLCLPLYAQETELSWEDLIPISEKSIIDAWFAKQNSLDADQFSEQEPPPQGAVRTDLNGQVIKIAGFVIPLEGDEEQITELLLVPYFGACFHVPPPPQNQIVYVKFADGVALKELWDVIYVVGTLTAETTSHEVAQVGYSMQGIRTEEYSE